AVRLRTGTRVRARRDRSRRHGRCRARGSRSDRCSRWVSSRLPPRMSLVELTGMVSTANDMGSTPLDSRDVADRVHSAAIHLLRRVRRVDEESGITAALLPALSVLVFGGPTTLGALARAEQVSAPTMSRLVTA